MATIGLRKLGLRLFFGLEANLVEDKVPIVL